MQYYKLILKQTNKSRKKTSKTDSTNPMGVRIMKGVTFAYV